MSESLVELRLCNFRMSSRGVILLSGALRFKPFWQKFTFHLIDVPSPDYLCVPIMSLGDVKDFWSASHPFSAIEICCLASFVARAPSLEEVFAEVDLNETSPRLDIRTCVRKLFAER